VFFGVGRERLASHVVSIAPPGAVVVIMSDHGGFLCARFAQLDDIYKV